MSHGHDMAGVNQAAANSSAVGQDVVQKSGLRKTSNTATPMTQKNGGFDGVIAKKRDMSRLTWSNGSWLFVPFKWVTDKLSALFDGFIAKARDASPAWLVNNGSRFCLAFKGGADGLSVWSSVRKGSKSPWRLAASGVSLFSEILGMQFAEKKISEETQQQYRHMPVVQYVATKTAEAFNPKDHITETAGVALIVNGAFMAMSGVQQSVKSRVSWEIIQGVMTSVAGMIMTYMPDRERAWQIAHGTFMVRSVPAALQAKNAYFVGVPEKNIAPGDWQQAAKWVLNQIANVLGTLYGGVKKMPDGSIVHIGKKGDEISAPRQSRKQLSSKVADVPVVRAGAMPETSVVQPSQLGRMANEIAIDKQVQAA